ncbi:hypothetical protein BURKHO8Y_140244 [Burkholderia sp. 8Y]|nr:hypothetical protein BURKHO8Y_140244 [Burkholderia sp. 8Y]
MATRKRFEAVVGLRVNVRPAVLDRSVGEPLHSLNLNLRDGGETSVTAYFAGARTGTLTCKFDLTKP